MSCRGLPAPAEAGATAIQLSASAGMTSSRDLFALRLLDVALELLAALGQLLVLGLHQEGVEAAAAFHGLERVRTDAQAHLALQRIGYQGYIAQVGPERALALVLGMAAQLSGHGQLAHQLASPGHFNNSSSPAVRRI